MDNNQGESSTSSNFFYDVFLSFSGEDTRLTFTSHLYSGLRRERINAFKDDKELKKGDVISMGLSKGIEDSTIAIVVLSKNYASSPWCLDELLKILECKKELNQRVMPIFYDVHPTEVRHQTGKFGEQFDKLKDRFTHQRIKKWEAALAQVVTISGRQLALHRYVFFLHEKCCKKLKELNLSYCKRLRKIPNFNGASSLETLQLQYCNLSDIPRDIGSLSSLISLDLSGNSFHGLPFDFSKLRFLKGLHLNDCENLQTLPSVSNLENLEIFELKNCQKLVEITELNNLPSILWINMRNCTSLQNPFNEGFFSAPALSESMKKPYQILRICVQCNEIPDWCSNKVTAPSIHFTMPTVHNNKFLGMVLWFVCEFSDVSTFRYFVVTVGNKKLFLTWNRYTETPQLHGEVSCIYYISHFNRPFDRQKIEGGEEVKVEEEVSEGTIKKIGIHLLYLDQHGNVTSLPANMDQRVFLWSKEALVLYDEYHYL